MRFKFSEVVIKEICLSLTFRSGIVHFSHEWEEGSYSRLVFSQINPMNFFENLPQDISQLF
jgi:hypothetical protein